MPRGRTTSRLTSRSRNRRRFNVRRLIWPQQSQKKPAGELTLKIEPSPEVQKISEGGLAQCNILFVYDPVTKIGGSMYLDFTDMRQEPDEKVVMVASKRVRDTVDTLIGEGVSRQNLQFIIVRRKIAESKGGIAGLIAHFGYVPEVLKKTEILSLRNQDLLKSALSKLGYPWKTVSIFTHDVTCDLKTGRIFDGNNEEIARFKKDESVNGPNAAEPKAARPADNATIIHSSKLSEAQVDRLAEFLVRENIAIGTKHANGQEYAIRVGRGHIDKITKESRGHESGFLAAFVNDEPANIITYSILPQGLREKMGYGAVLNGDLYLTPVYGRNDIDTSLVRSVEDYLRAKGIQKYSLIIAPETKGFWAKIMPPKSKIIDKGDGSYRVIVSLMAQAVQSKETGTGLQSAGPSWDNLFDGRNIRPFKVPFIVGIEGRFSLNQYDVERVMALEGVEEVVVPVPDIHADLQGLRDWLEAFGVIKKGEAIDGSEDVLTEKGKSLKLIQMGDVIDHRSLLEPTEKTQREKEELAKRSKDSLEYLCLLSQKGADITRICGNHELIYLAKGTEKSSVYQLMNGWNTVLYDDDDFIKALRRDVMEERLKAAECIGGVVFIHGGIVPEIVEAIEATVGKKDLSPEDLTEAINDIFVNALKASERGESDAFSHAIFNVGHGYEEGDPGTHSDKYKAGVFGAYFGRECVRMESTGYKQVVAHHDTYYRESNSLGAIIGGDIVCAACNLHGHRGRRGRAAVIFEPGQPGYQIQLAEKTEETSQRAKPKAAGSVDGVAPDAPEEEGPVDGMAPSQIVPDRGYIESLYKKVFSQRGLEGDIEGLLKHIKRGGIIAERIADRLGLDEAERDILLISFWLHDIGKLHSQDLWKLILSPQPITRDPSHPQRRLINNHPKYSVEIIRGLIPGVSSDIIELVRNHSNPENIRDERLRRFGEIIYWADRVDAMMARRPYQNDHWNIDSTRDLLHTLERVRRQSFDEGICRHREIYGVLNDFVRTDEFAKLYPEVKLKQDKAAIPEPAGPEAARPKDDVVLGSKKINIPAGYHVIQMSNTLEKKRSYRKHLEFLIKKVRQAREEGLVPLLVGELHRPSLALYRAVVEVVGDRDRPQVVSFDNHVDFGLRWDNEKRTGLYRDYIFWWYGINHGILPPKELLVAGIITFKFVMKFRHEVWGKITDAQIRRLAKDVGLREMKDRAELMEHPKLLEFLKKHKLDKNSLIKDIALIEDVLAIYGLEIQIAEDVINGNQIKRKSVLVSYDTDVDMPKAILYKNAKVLKEREVVAVHICGDPNDQSEMFEPKALERFLDTIITGQRRRGRPSSSRQVAGPRSPEPVEGPDAVEPEAGPAELTPQVLAKDPESDVTFIPMSRENILKHKEELLEVERKIFSPTVCPFVRFLGDSEGEEDALRVEEDFSEFILVGGKLVGYVVAHKDTIEGWDMETSGGRKSVYAIDSALRLRRIAILNTYRGSGLASQALNRMSNKALERGIEKVFARTRFVESAEEVKRSFLENSGFKTIGRVSIKGYPSAVWEGKSERIFDATKTEDGSQGARSKAAMPADGMKLDDDEEGALVDEMAPGRMAPDELSRSPAFPELPNGYLLPIIEAWHKISNIGTLEEIRSMNQLEFAKRLGAKEIKTMLIGFPGIFCVSSEVWQQIDSSRKKYAEGQELAFSNDASEAVFNCAEINSPGIYYNKARMEEGGETEKAVYKTKTAFSHEVFETCIADAGMVNGRMYDLTGHYHIEVIKATLEFARLMGKDEQRIFMKWRDEIKRRVPSELKSEMLGGLEDGPEQEKLKKTGDSTQGAVPEAARPADGMAPEGPSRSVNPAWAYRTPIFGTEDEEADSKDLPRRDQDALGCPAVSTRLR